MMGYENLLVCPSAQEPLLFDHYYCLGGRPQKAGANDDL